MIVVRSGRAARLALVGAALVVVAVWGWANLTDDGEQYGASPAPTPASTTGTAPSCLSPEPDAMVTVPDVIGLPVNGALDLLRDRGLCPSVNEGDPEGGVVVAQEPGGGEQIPRGSGVGLRTRAP